MSCNKKNVMKNLSSALVVIFASFATGAGAAMIEFTYTGTGSGSIGTSAFQNASFVITELSDTSTIQSCGTDCSFIDANSTSISIEGIGSFLFTTGTRTFDNSGYLGFSRSGIDGLDLYNGFHVGSWDMMTSIGPVFDNPYFLQWSYTPVNTNGGILSFNDGYTSGTFQASTTISPVPEPETYAMLLAGLGLFGFMTGRKRQHFAA